MDAEADFSLTSSQRRIVLMQLAGYGMDLLICCTYVVPNDMTGRVVERTREMLRNCPILRTKLVDGCNFRTQLSVSYTTTDCITWITPRADTVAGHAYQLETDLLAERVDPFIGPLWRAYFAHFGDDTTITLLAHHIIYDGETHSRVIQSMFGDESEGLQPCDASAWAELIALRARIESTNLDDAAQFWRRLSSEYSINAPTAAESGEGIVQCTEVRLDSNVADAIRRAQRVAKTSAVAMFANQFAVMIRDYAPNVFTHLAIPVSTRRPKESSVPGCFTNLLLFPVRSCCSSVRDTGRLLHDGLKYSHVPVDAIVRRVAALRRANAAELIVDRPVPSPAELLGDAIAPTGERMSRSMLSARVTPSLDGTMLIRIAKHRAHYELPHTDDLAREFVERCMS